MCGERERRAYGERASSFAAQTIKQLQETIALQGTLMPIDYHLLFANSASLSVIRPSCIHCQSITNN